VGDLSIGIELDKELAQLLAKTSTKTIDLTPRLTYEQVARRGTGSVMLDWATSGGWAIGRWNMVYGYRSSGKTTSVLLAIKELQRRDPKAWSFIIDTEHALDLSYASRLVDMSRVAYYSDLNMTTESAWNKLRLLARTDRFAFGALDSIGMMVAKAQSEGAVGDQNVALNARINKDAITMITPELAQTQTAILWTNHITNKIGVQHGNPETLPGGTKVEFAPSLTVRFNDVYKSKGAKYDASGTPIAIRQSGFVQKNKVGPPWRDFEYWIRLRPGQYGVDIIEEVAALAVQFKLLLSESGLPYTSGKKAFLGKALIHEDFSSIPAPKKENKAAQRLAALLREDAKHNNALLFNAVFAQVQECIAYESMYIPAGDEDDEAEEEVDAFDEAFAFNGPEFAALDSAD